MRDRNRLLSRHLRASDLSLSEGFEQDTALDSVDFCGGSAVNRHCSRGKRKAATPHSRANTHTAPPAGQSAHRLGKKRATCVVIPRASPSQPDSTARYCLHSTVNVVGGARSRVGDETQSSLPDVRRTHESSVDCAPLNTRPPAGREHRAPVRDYGDTHASHALPAVDIPR